MSHRTASDRLCTTALHYHSLCEAVIHDLIPSYHTLLRWKTSPISSTTGTTKNIQEQRVNKLLQFTSEAWNLAAFLQVMIWGPAPCLLVFTLHYFIVFWFFFAVTLASFSSCDSSGFSLFCYLLPCFSLLTPSFLSLSHSSAIPAVCKKPPQLIGARHRGALSSLQTHFFLSSEEKKKKKSKHVGNVTLKCSHLVSRCEEDKTRCRIRSYEWRSAKQRPLLNPCGPCCTQWQGFPPASLSSIQGAKCVTMGGP